MEKRSNLDWFYIIDLAYAITLHELGLVQPRTIGSLQKAYTSIKKEEGCHESYTDYLYLQRRLLELDGKGLGSMHIGRSRQDLLITLQKLRCVTCLLRVQRSLLALREVTLAKAEQHAEAICPSYTNGVQAQPTVYGHVLLGFESQLSRSFRRIQQSLEDWGKCPLGVGALATSSFWIDRNRLGELLGFRDIEENGFDAAQLGSIDNGIAIAGNIAALAGSLSTWVQDVHGQYRAANPWLLLNDPELVQPSTLMPQKRNPVGLNWARTSASQTVGRAMSVITVRHNIPSGMTDYKRDDIEFMLDDAETLLGLVERIVHSLEYDATAALSELSSEYSTASELANILVRTSGISFSTAHTLVQNLVKFARKQNIPLVALTQVDLDREWHSLLQERRFPLSLVDYRKAVDPLRMVQTYSGTGGPQRASMGEMLEHARIAFWEDRTFLESRISDWELVEPNLKEIAEAIIAYGQV